MLAWSVACGPSVGVPSAGASESTTSVDSTSTGGVSLTATATSSPSTSEASTGSADITSGETTIALDVGDGSSSSSSDDPPWLVHCERCGPDEVCLDTCSPSLACVPIPEECEEVTCDDPDCAQALCGDEECLGYGARSCQGTISEAFVCGQSGSSIICDVWAQDCMPDDKCTSSSEDGGEYDTAQCTPISLVTVGVGEPCTVQGYATSGTDDCELGAQCLDVDPVTLVGTCRSSCSGIEANPSCDDPSMTCTIMGNYFAWCLP